SEPAMEDSEPAMEDSEPARGSRRRALPRRESPRPAGIPPPGTGPAGRPANAGVALPGPRPEETDAATTCLRNGSDMNIRTNKTIVVGASLLGTLLVAGGCVGGADSADGADSVEGEIGSSQEALTSVPAPSIFVRSTGE